jgi:hypothetical protein
MEQRLCCGQLTCTGRSMEKDQLHVPLSPRDGETRHYPRRTASSARGDAILAVAVRYPPTFKSWVA